MILETELKAYINYKHLYLCKNEYKAIYLGYPFKVTRTQYLILEVLIKRSPKPVSAEKLAAMLSEDTKSSNVAYHVFKINECARQIGNRSLIKNISKNGYFLNEEM